MWGKFFAFAMLVLMVLVIAQFSSLSDSDVEKIKAQIEEQQRIKQSEENKSPSVSSQQPHSQTTITETDVSLLAEPSIMAYETLLDAAPAMTSLSEIDRYYLPSVIEQYKNSLSDFSQNPLESFKGMHDLQKMEYMKLDQIGSETAIITLIASNAMSRAIGSAEQEFAGITMCQVIMVKQGDAWLIQNENWAPFPDQAMLNAYKKKRQARADNS